MDTNLNSRLYVSLFKKASLNDFSEVHSLDDITQIKLINEMLRLPKYECIKESLRRANSSGIINFIDNSEFPALVELLVKSVFPPAHMDIYDAGTGAYSIDCSNLPGDLNEARSVLNRMVMGSVKKWTPEDVKEAQNNHAYFPTGEEAEQAIGAYQAFTTQIQQNRKTVASLSSKLYEDDRKKRAIVDSQIRMDALEVEKKTAKDAKKMQAASKEMELLKDQIEGARKELLKPDERDTIKRVLESNRSELFKQENAMEAMGIPITYGTVPIRNKDGFMDYDPLHTLKEAGGLLTSGRMPSKPREEQKKAVSDFLSIIYKYRVEDVTLLKLKKQIIDFLGGYTGREASNPLDGFDKMMANQVQFKSMVSTFCDKAAKQGSLMVLENIEGSAFCRSERGDVRLSHPTIFESYIGRSTASKTLSLQSNTRKYPKSILIMSHQKINGLKCTPVTMVISPVDEAEAEIIVDNLMSPYNKRAMAAEDLRLKRDIIKSNKSPEEQASEMAKVSTHFSGKTDFIAMDRTAEKKMMQMIIGLGQEEAIDLISGVLSSSEIIEKDPDDDVVVKVGIDDKKVIKHLHQFYNDRIAGSLRELGVEKREANLPIDHYFYKENTDWEEQVEQVKVTAYKLEAMRNDINDKHRNMISKNLQLPKANPSEKLKLEGEIKILQEEIARLNEKYDNIITAIPHMYMLYGHPGTGKTVWAEVLASLIGGSYFNVNVSQAKNKWVGGTEANTAKLMATISASRNCVWLIDEIDRQVSMGEGGVDSAAHETTQSQVQMLLDTFQNNVERFKRQNVYIVMATNNIKAISPALLNRVTSYGTKAEVERITDPGTYKKYFKDHVFEILKLVTKGTSPLLADGGQEQAWAEVNKLMGNIDWDTVSETFASKAFPFRMLENIIRRALEQHQMYINTDQNSGFPFTTENLLLLAKYADPGLTRNEDENLAILTVARLWRQKSKPQKVDADQQMSFSFETPTKKEEQVKEVDKLQDIPFEGDVPETISENAPETEGIEESLGKPKNKGAKSSTDYMYDYLRKLGIVSAAGKLKGKDLDDEDGIYDCGQVFIMPASVNVPRQRLRENLRKKHPQAGRGI